MIAQKYKNAVMKVITILSECVLVSILVSICSIRFGFRLNNGLSAGRLSGAFTKVRNCYLYSLPQAA
jgi:hypothetical protein